MFGKALRFVVPTILSMWVFLLYTLVDGLFVGRFVGSDGLAIVTLAMPLLNVVFAFGVLFGIGGAVRSAISYGKGDEQQGHDNLSRSIIMSFSFGVIVTVLLSIFLPRLAEALGGEGVLKAGLMTYLRCLLPFFPFFMTGYGLEVACKVDKSPSFPLFAVCIGGVINLVGDYVTVVHFGLGLVGAGLCTGAAQLVTCSMLFARLKWYPKRVRLTLPKGSIIAWTKVALAGGSEFWAEICTGLMLLLYNKAIISSLRESALASFGVVTYLANFALMSTIGTGQGILPLLSEHRGRGEPKKVVRLSLYSFFLALALGVGFYALGAFGGGRIGQLFLPKGPTALIRRVFYIYGIGFILWVPNIIVASFFTALGRPKVATAVMLLRGLIILPCCIAAFYTFSPQQLWWAGPVGELLTAVLVLPLYVHRLKGLGSEKSYSN